jgi:hypothetical protein
MIDVISMYFLLGDFVYLIEFLLSLRFPRLMNGHEHGDTPQYEVKLGSIELDTPLAMINV